MTREESSVLIDLAYGLIGELVKEYPDTNTVGGAIDALHDAFYTES